MSTPLEDYAIIGDCETVALVSRRGSIDWLCWPRFDSGACFAGLLGTAEHGRWLVEAVDADAQVTRRYRPNTLILETTIETRSGTAIVIDFMPLRGRNSDVVRLVRGDRGRVEMRTELVLRFDYGSTVPWVSRLPDGTLRAIAGPDMVVIHTPVSLRGEDLKTVATFEVAAGDTVPLVLTHGPSHLPPPEAIDVDASLEATEKFWVEWTARNQSQGEWSDAVSRSLITLKALTYAPTGGMVAAPTTSLPEKLGGVRNWDYRFCWLRDATLTLLALMNAGYYDEAQAWRDWLLRAAAGSPSQLQIMYGLAGERRLSEYEVPWLPGYEQSTPVRIGNAAHGQLQLDVYGEVVDTLFQGKRGGLETRPADWNFLRAILEHLEQVWSCPDKGVWETRGDPQHFTFSKIMSWVALDRGIRAIEGNKVEGPVARWREVRQRIHAEVCARGFNTELGSFVQSYDSKDLDASLLLLPTTGFLPPDDPRVHGTIDAIQRRLFVDGFVLRYDAHTSPDGLPPGLRNDLGLLSEEYDTSKRRLVGNFPQAFSHIALVNSAHNLGHAVKPAEQRSSRDNAER